MASTVAALMTCLFSACGGGTGGSDLVAADAFASAAAEAASSVVSASSGGALPSGGGSTTSVPPVVPPVTVPPAGAPPATVPPVTVPPITVPPLTVPPITVPPVTVPPVTVPPVTVPPVAGVPPVVAVDLSKVPPASVGTSTLSVSPTTEIAPPGEGAFRTVCAVAHMSFDDPIVFPGQPGRSHLHTFFGNTGANANSTPESLRNTGNSTCRGGVANRSAYWVPTMIDTKDNTPLQPAEVIVYYKNGYLDATKVQPIPTGLRMIAGDPNASAPHPDVFSMRWKCIGGPNNQNDLYGHTIANCDVGASLYQEIFFPQCWDGVNLDSPDHMSHMSYTVQVKNVNDPRGWSHAECPKTHPVILPQIAFNVLYLVGEKDAPLRWRLASDTYDKSKPGGYSSHGDWFNGWKSDISNTWAKNCIENQKDCHAHLLGDGRQIF